MRLLKFSQNFKTADAEDSKPLSDEDKAQVFDDVVQFFVKNDKPSDKAVHELAEDLGHDPSAIEEIIYELAGSFVNILTNGKSVDAGVGEDDVDPDELARGIEVEKEHTSNEFIAKKIALDHLAEIEDYYTRLAEMENA